MPPPTPRAPPRSFGYTPRAMRILTLLLLSAVACDSSSNKTGTIPVDTGEDSGSEDSVVKPPEIVLGDPYVVMVGAASPGNFASTCELDLKLADVAGNASPVNLSLNSKGCDWTGAGLTGGVQYRGQFTETGCNGAADKSYDVQTFSGQKGFMFVMWYSGVNIGYSQLEQGTESGDFEGGEAHVTVTNSFPDANVQSIASGLGVTATLESTSAAGNVYVVTWESELNVGEVLSGFTSQAGENYVSGEPIWISKPSWWPKCG